MEFGIQTDANLIRNLSLSSSSYKATTVAETQVIEHSGAKVGYLVFTSFLETSRDELDAAFAELRAANVTELILDLRYNRGGRVGVANKLASMILGDDTHRNTFVTVALNDKYKSGNLSVPFTSEQQSLDLSRVLVLTTASSCSASELVINSLRPFIDVVLIGQDTCGKPYGSVGRNACGKQMNALEFEFVNASNVGGYYDGIRADCVVDDDLEHRLGDPMEAMLDAGLSYVAASSCQPIVAHQQRSRPIEVTHPWQPHEPPGISDLSGILIRP